MGPSIRWRLIIINLLLILIAMELTGVYLIQALEKYYISSYAATVESQAQLVAGFLERYMGSEPDRARISQLVREFGRQSRFDIVVLGSNGALLGTSGDDPKELERALNKSEISRALSGGRGQATGIAPATGDEALHLVEPIRLGERIAGLVYVIASLEGTYQTLADVRRILGYSALLALGVTAILGFVVSQTITGPIQEITVKARRMAAGDFSQTLEARSGDEIGQLAAMFNRLAGRLRETLEEISGEKSKLEAMLANMADGVVAVDAGGSIMAMNLAAGRMLGVDPAGAIGKPLQGPLAESARQFGVGDRTIVARYAPIRAEAGGERTGAVIVLQDVTEAERLERLRREFVANVSHELKTPLTSVKSYVETLADGAVDDPALTRQFLLTISRETERMTRLVRDLLDLAAIDQKDTPWNRRPLALGEVVQEAAALMKPQAEKKGVAMSVDVSDGLPLVVADSDRMQQVAVNVLANAVEFTPPGGRVTVSVRSRGDAVHDAVHVAIRDTGIGIPEEDLPRVFERFYRVDKARSRELGGTGLGLSIAREIVLAHGGDITISSRLGEGTEVEFWIPAQDGGGDGAGDATRRAQEAGRAPARRRTRKGGAPR